MEQYSINVLAEDFESAHKKVVKVIRKVEKLGLSVDYYIGKVEESEHKGEKYLTRNIVVEVEEPILKHEGFTYKATLEKSDVGNLIYTRLSDDFSEYFNAKFRCDHCNTNRDRKKVHLFEDENGNDLLIATTCSKEYFGEDFHKVINNSLKGFDLLQQFVDYQDLELLDVEDHISKFHTGGDLDNFIDYALYVIISNREYISRDKAEYQQRLSTGDLVENTIAKGRPEDFDKVIGEYNDLEKIRNFWKDQLEKDRTPFANNVYTSFYATKFKKGLIAYGVWVYLNTATNLFTINTIDEFYGEAKKRYDLELKVTNVSSGYSDYGWWESVSFVDRDGHRFNWFSSSCSDAVEEAKKTSKFVKLKGTVKEHKTYKGKKITQLTRVK